MYRYFCIDALSIWSNCFESQPRDLWGIFLMSCRPPSRSYSATSCCIAFKLLQKNCWVFWPILCYFGVCRMLQLKLPEQCDCCSIQLRLWETGVYMAAWIQHSAGILWFHLMEGRHIPVSVLRTTRPLMRSWINRCCLSCWITNCSGFQMMGVLMIAGQPIIFTIFILLLFAVREPVVLLLHEAYPHIHPMEFHFKTSRATQDAMERAQGHMQQTQCQTQRQTQCHWKWQRLWSGTQMALRGKRPRCQATTWMVELKVRWRRDYPSPGTQRARTLKQRKSRTIGCWLTFLEHHRLLPSCLRRCKSLKKVRWGTMAAAKTIRCYQMNWCACHLSLLEHRLILQLRMLPSWRLMNRDRRLCKTFATLCKDVKSASFFDQ